MGTVIVLACIVILLGHEFQTTSCTYLHIEQYNPASYLSTAHFLGIILALFIETHWI